MGPLIFVIFLAIAFGGLIAFVAYLQKKEAAKFGEECQKYGWKKVSQNNGYDVLPENDEEWKVESRVSNPNSPSSVEWTHPMVSRYSSLIILPKSGLAMLNDIPIKGAQLTNPGIFDDVKPLSIGSEDFGKRYSVYGASDIEEHPFISEKIESILNNYDGADFMLLLFPDRLEIRLRDRNVQSQVPALIQLGQGIIKAQMPV